jgi:hypothetical protein
MTVIARVGEERDVIVVEEREIEEERRAEEEMRIVEGIEERRRGTADEISPHFN